MESHSSSLHERGTGLAAAWADLGIPRHTSVLVHSAFHGIGRQGVVPTDFLAQMLDFVGSGTLLMPTMSWRAVTPANPIFSARTTPSITGILTEVFRTQMASHRSVHPTHSVAALGAAAAEMTAGPAEVDTPCSDQSAFGRLAFAGGWIVLLGVGLECCTNVHCAEEKIAPDLYLTPAVQAETYRCEDLAGVVHQVRTRRHLRLNRDFEKFRARLREQAGLREGEVLGVTCSAVRADRLTTVLETALIADSRATLRPD